MSLAASPATAPAKTPGILDRFGRAIGGDRTARAVVVAPRIPSLDRKTYNGNPFTSAGDVVADCDVVKADGTKCGWHAMGSRADVRLAWNEHYRQFHGADQAVGVLLLNTPKQ